MTPSRELVSEMRDSECGWGGDDGVNIGNE